jgi:hypothetical protein
VLGERGSPCQRVPYLRGQASDQGVECRPAAGTVAQILMHRDPRLQLEFEVPREDAHKRGLTFGQGNLANADAATCAQKRELPKVAVAP